MSCFHSSLALHEFFFSYNKTFRQSIRFYDIHQFPFQGLLADLPVGFPYRFNSSVLFLIISLLLLRSADKVGRPFCFCSVSYYFFSSFLFFFTATCELQFLRHFSTYLDEICYVDSPWCDEQTEYFFKSIGLGVGTGRGPKILLCFIIGKTLYSVRRDKNFT